MRKIRIKLDSDQAQWLSTMCERYLNLYHPEKNSYHAIANYLLAEFVIGLLPKLIYFQSKYKTISITIPQAAALVKCLTQLDLKTNIWGNNERNILVGKLHQLLQ